MLVKISDGYCLFLFVLFITIYFILTDELLMSCSQIRIGPFNLGFYGLFSSVINGLNLVVSQFSIPKTHIYFVFQVLPIAFFVVSLLVYTLVYPFLLVDLMLTVILVLICSSFSILFIILTAYSGCSRYALLGTIRIISQLISYELLSSTIVLLVSYKYYDLSLTSI